MRSGSFLSLFPIIQFTLPIARSLGKNILSDLAGLLEDRRIKKVLYDAKPVLAFIRASENRKLNACNIFDLMLASQICWSGYYYLTPSGSPKNPWKKKIPDHSLAALAERHLGIILDGEGERCQRICRSIAASRYPGRAPRQKRFAEDCRSGIQSHFLPRGDGDLGNSSGLPSGQRNCRSKRKMRSAIWSGPCRMRPGRRALSQSRMTARGSATI